MKEQILKLRSEGKTYNEIVSILNCSKGTVSYYCGENQKEKSRIRLKKSRITKKRILSDKLDKFINRALDMKIRDFGRERETAKMGKLIEKINKSELFDKMVNNNFCYLTGREIDLTLPSTYQFDHIIPVSKKGNLSLDNLGLTCRDANMAKHNMLLDDFINLCKDVLENFGYKVILN